jgi:threonine dehydratase
VSDAIVVEREDVLCAAEVIRGRVHRTPLLPAPTLAPGVRLKAELFQHTGSFKARGVLNKLASLTPEEKARGVIGISAGNHAAALAWGAASDGIDCLVVMISSAIRTKVEATRAYGAAIDMDSADWVQAFARFDELVAGSGRTVVHPHSDPLVIAGQGTVGLEVEEDAPDTEVVLVAGGGGGLGAGVAAALPERRVVVVEPEGAAVIHASLAAGHPVSVSPVSIADGLCTPYTAETALNVLRERAVESVLVSEAEIEDAFRWLYQHAKLACEPAAATALAPLLSGRIEADSVVVVVSGGNVAAETAAAILARS